MSDSIKAEDLTNDLRARLNKLGQSQESSRLPVRMTRTQAAILQAMVVKLGEEFIMSCADWMADEDGKQPDPAAVNELRFSTAETMALAYGYLLEPHQAADAVERSRANLLSLLYAAAQDAHNLESA